ncbi:hypothetical protein AMECASPLE_000264 [Ameca splendens]|uniref:Uncharacterized protein n=1 Tax=Ameca splendens TaxID=208324 RepID=A0ABV0Z7R9_9TELE
MGSGSFICKMGCFSQPLCVSLPHEQCNEPKRQGDGGFHPVTSWQTGLLKFSLCALQFTSGSPPFGGSFSCVCVKCVDGLLVQWTMLAATDLCNPKQGLHKTLHS